MPKYQITIPLQIEEVYEVEAESVNKAIDDLYCDLMNDEGKYVGVQNFREFDNVEFWRAEEEAEND